jgi:hypothetical protein
MADVYKYRVFVDDNFHYMDPDERYELGSFEDCESAVAACKRIVDELRRRPVDRNGRPELPPILRLGLCQSPVQRAWRG